MYGGGDGYYGPAYGYYGELFIEDIMVAYPSGYHGYYHGGYHHGSITITGITMGDTITGYWEIARLKS